jgi:hypothetical protein
VEKKAELEAIVKPITDRIYASSVGDGGGDAEPEDHDGMCLFKFNLTFRIVIESIEFVFETVP